MSTEVVQGGTNRTVRDLMIPLDAYPHIGDDCTIAEAISVITGAQIERKGKLSLPRIILIIDDNHSLLGLVRRRDIMRGLLPGFLTRTGERHAESHFELDPAADLPLAELFRESDHKLLSRRAEAPVSSVMQPFEESIDVDADLIELMRKMVINEFHFLPVTQDDNVVGVVRTVEILNQVNRILAS